MSAIKSTNLDEPRRNTATNPVVLKTFGKVKSKQAISSIRPPIAIRSGSKSKKFGSRSKNLIAIQPFWISIGNPNYDRDCLFFYSTSVF